MLETEDDCMIAFLHGRLDHKEMNHKEMNHWLLNISTPYPEVTVWPDLQTSMTSSEVTDSSDA